ncbi:hypothetical protein TNIN_224191 [Trichonephila inaurata madagascariensis]|uniref:Uncharacterized protein n=1 Tax=Trichonephila inaurata madagascariensis TaxID=2747483 RepID=A0A8X6WRP0_9ARAC|nr:hypothetical protein TNIN_224191 [Trichonephila inaurata madagascariensis]
MATACLTTAFNPHRLTLITSKPLGIDRRVRQQAINSKGTLRKAIEHAWVQISPETTKNLFISIQTKSGVLLQKGPTKYSLHFAY